MPMSYTTNSTPTDVEILKPYSPMMIIQGEENVKFLLGGEMSSFIF